MARLRSNSLSLLFIFVSWMTSCGAELADEGRKGGATVVTSSFLITSVVGVGSLLGLFLLLICCVHKKKTTKERVAGNEKHLEENVGQKVAVKYTELHPADPISDNFGNVGRKDIFDIKDETDRVTGQPNGPHSKLSARTAAVAETGKVAMAADGTGRLQALLEAHGEADDDDEEIEAVPLTSWDETGLGFDVTGNTNDGILVKNVHSSGPAKQSGKMNYGDRIVSLAISMRQMTLKDAQALLEIAAKYPTELHIIKSSSDVVVHALTPEAAKMISGQSKTGEMTSGLDFLSTEKRSKSADCLTTTTTVENEDSMMRSGRHFSIGDLTIPREMSSSKLYEDEMMDLEKRASWSDSSSDVIVVIPELPTDHEKVTEVGNHRDTASHEHDNLAFNWNDEKPIDLEERGRKEYREKTDGIRNKKKEITDDDFLHSKPHFDSDLNLDFSEFNINTSKNTDLNDPNKDHLQRNFSRNVEVGERNFSDGLQTVPLDDELNYRPSLVDVNQNFQKIDGITRVKDIEQEHSIMSKRGKLKETVEVPGVNPLGNQNKQDLRETVSDAVDIDAAYRHLASDVHSSQTKSTGSPGRSKSIESDTAGADLLVGEATQRRTSVETSPEVKGSSTFGSKFKGLFLGKDGGKKKNRSETGVKVDDDRGAASSDLTINAGHDLNLKTALFSKSLSFEDDAAPSAVDLGEDSDEIVSDVVRPDLQTLNNKMEMEFDDRNHGTADSYLQDSSVQNKNTLLFQIQEAAIEEIKDGLSLSPSTSGIDESSPSLGVSGNRNGMNAAGKHREEDTTGKDLGKATDQRDFEKEFFQVGNDQNLRDQISDLDGQDFGREPDLKMTDDKTTDVPKYKEQIFPVDNQSVSVGMTSRAAAGQEDLLKSSRMEKKMSGDVPPEIVTIATPSFDETVGTKQKKSFGGKIKGFFSPKKGGGKSKEEPPISFSIEPPSDLIIHRGTVAAEEGQGISSSVTTTAGVHQEDELVMNESGPTTTAAGALAGGDLQEDGLTMIDGKKTFDAAEEERLWAEYVQNGIGIHSTEPSAERMISPDYQEKLDESDKPPQLQADKDRGSQDYNLPKTKKKIGEDEDVEEAIVEFKAPPKKRGLATAVINTDHTKHFSAGDPGQDFFFGLENGRKNQGRSENDHVFSSLGDTGNQLYDDYGVADDENASKMKLSIDGKTVYPEKKNLEKEEKEEEEEENSSATNMYKVNGTGSNYLHHNHLHHLHERHHGHHNSSEEKQRAMSRSLDNNDHSMATTNGNNRHENNSTTSNDILPSSFPTSNAPESFEFLDLNRFALEPLELPSWESLRFSTDGENDEQPPKTSVLNVALGGGNSTSGSGSSLAVDRTSDKKTRELFLIRSDDLNSLAANKKSNGDTNNNNFEMESSNA